MASGFVPPYLRAPSDRDPAALRHLLRQPGALVVPGIVDVLSARLAEQAGFSACYVTGAGLANAHFGMADVGLTGLSDVVAQVFRIAGGVSLPLFVDADTGYGNALSVMHTVAELERAGASAIQLEDQLFPKRCGHFDRKLVIDATEMEQKIRAACEARSSSDLLVIARTDANAVLGFDEAVSRARRYRDAGADILFLEAPTSMEQLGQVPRLLEGSPTLANVVEGGRTPVCTVTDLEAMGYKIVVYANLALRASIGAVRDVFQHLRATGDSRPLMSKVASWEERQALVFLPQVEQLERELGVGAATSNGSEEAAQHREGPN
jgi:2-methylisocitrate lyase-like PEP mutase family enzyme